MNMIIKVVAFVFGALCILSAVLQYNDPDPLMWILIYAISAILSIGFAFNKIPVMALLVAGILAIGGGFYLFPGQFQGFEIGNGDIKNIEEGREAVGLFILGAAFLFFALIKRFLQPSKV